MTYYVVNERGLAEIREFLNSYHISPIDWSDGELRAWAREAEFQAAEGNPPSIEIPYWNSLTGYTVEYTITQDGIDAVEEEERE